MSKFSPPKKKMNSFPHGFLSEPFDEVRLAVRNQYATRRAVFVGINEQCVTAQHEIRVRLDEPRDLLGAALFARTLASTQAAVLLLEHGLISQAKVILRSALEALFALAAIARKPELALPLAQSQQADKQSLADKMLKWESAELKSSRSEWIDEAKLKAIKLNTSRAFNTAQLARDADMMDHYYSMYSLLSFPTHVNLSDLTSHLVTDHEGNVKSLRNEPQIDGQEAVWGFAAEIQVHAASALRTIFDVHTVDVESYAQAVRDLPANG